MAKSRKLQEIFDVVIDKGYYGFPGGESSCMCLALNSAMSDNIITDVEYKKAMQSIRNYMLGYQGILRRLLRHNDLPCEHQDRLAIYRNWSKRPKIKIGIL